LQAGFSLIEALITVAITGILMAALGGVVGQALQTGDVVREHNDLAEEAAFAMERMVRAVGLSRGLILPLGDNPDTAGVTENIRDSSTNGGVLAVRLPAYVDLDADGSPDADNDGDGRLDEDLPADATNDGAPGIRDIDDDGDGGVDPSLSPVGDDDESSDLAEGEDPINGLDDDGDGTVDEDPGDDRDGDGCPGSCGMDDDYDGTADEGSAADDDEDGQADEDWYDPVVFHLQGEALVERMPVPWDENSSGGMDGQDYIESTIADNVSQFRVERIPQGGDRAQRVDLTLELSGPSGETISLHTQVRVGGAL
jgi:prepilin-type N-terminal cleavage/methylation domain-containing protein